MSDDGVITLIGGPARVGKTTLARRWVGSRAVEWVQLDHLLHSVAAVATGAARDALNKAPSIDTHSEVQWLSALRERDAVLWQAAHAYADAARGELVIEGGLWPDWMARLQWPHVGIFLVDTSSGMAERLIEIVRAHPESWMAQRGYSDAKIRKWATYNRFRSQQIAELADLHGYRVFDIAACGISDTQEAALRYLADRARNGCAQGVRGALTAARENGYRGGGAADT